jgi:O-antigen ligase
MSIFRFKRNESNPSLAALVSDGIIQYLLPVGFFVLLTGLFWLGDKSFYHKLYYLLVSAPTLAVFLLRQTGTLKKLLRNPIIFTFILFGTYTILTLFWSDTDQAISSLVRRPLNLFLLFLAFGLVALKTPGKIFNILYLSAKVAVVCGGLSLIYFFFTQYNNGLNFSTLPRFPGYGAISNPLLTSHVYGFFTAYYIAVWFNKSRVNSCYLIFALSILFLVILSTGSRTPLLAITISVIWLSVSCWNKRSLYSLVLITTLGSILFIFIPQKLLRAGFSSRPEIWEEAFKQALNNIWFGHGYGQKLLFEAVQKTWNNPHNIELVVLISGGLVGLTLWLLMYAFALNFAWKNRKDSMVSITSSLVVFGLTAGLTDGSTFMPRPNEFWFLVWIPLILLYAAWLMKDCEQQQPLNQTS